MYSIVSGHIHTMHIISCLLCISLLSKKTQMHTDADTYFIHRDLTDSLNHFLYPLAAALYYAIHPKAIIHLYQ